MFTGVTSARGVHFQHIASHTPNKYLIETMGPGVALFDHDNDGWLDIYLPNGSTFPALKGKGPAPRAMLLPVRFGSAGTFSAEGAVASALTNALTSGWVLLPRSSEKR